MSKYTSLALELHRETFNKREVEELIKILNQYKPAE
jgi:hypothetical protein